MELLILFGVSAVVGVVFGVALILLCNRWMHINGLEEV